MLTRCSSSPRGGALVIVLAGLGLLSVGTVAAVSFRSSSPTDTATAKPRRLQPGEVATVLHLAGITPESLAAAGLLGVECEAVFQTGGVYCLQAERLTQFQLAHRNVNLAKEHAVHPTSPEPAGQGGQAISVAQAQTALDNLSSQGFSAFTTGLDAGTVAKLTHIKANAAWGIPTPYLTVDRADEDWLRLRGALVARSYATGHGETLPAGPAQILATAEANATVAQALQDHANHIASIRQTWRAHETAP